MTTKVAEKADLSLRHTLATLGYRAAKVLRDAPAEFSNFRAAEGSRSAGEILAHLGDLLDWALTQARGQERWRETRPQAWSAGAERFFAALKALDEHLAAAPQLQVPAEKIFQGAVADALTHVGQIALLRRLAGSRVRGENYSRAKIEAGRTGPDQPAAVAEFD